MSPPLLSIQNLTKKYKTNGKVISAIKDLSLDMREKEIVGLVGESGSGKTTLAKLLLSFIQPTEGKIYFQGQELIKVGDQQRRQIQMIFQQPGSSLNPAMKIKDILLEPLKLNGEQNLSLERVVSLLQQVGLSESHLNVYPRNLSGGQQQRVSIARALTLQPSLLICDEPLSALDASTQAKIVDLFLQIHKEKNLTYLFISHDLDVIRHICDRVVVMYLGQIVECGPVSSVFQNPQHPYTRTLLAANPSTFFFDLQSGAFPNDR